MNQLTISFKHECSQCGFDLKIEVNEMHNIVSVQPCESKLCITKAVEQADQGTIKEVYLNRFSEEVEE